MKIYKQQSDQYKYVSASENNVRKHVQKHLLRIILDFIMGSISVDLPEIYRYSKLITHLSSDITFIDKYLYLIKQYPESTLEKQLTAIDNKDKADKEKTPV